MCAVNRGRERHGMEIRSPAIKVENVGLAGSQGQRGLSGIEG